MSVGGSVWETAGCGRAVAVAARSTAGGRGALGTVRVATGAATAVALRGRRVARRGCRRTRRVRIGTGAARLRANGLRVGVRRLVATGRSNIRRRGVRRGITRGRHCVGRNRWAGVGRAYPAGSVEVAVVDHFQALLWIWSYSRFGSVGAH